MAIGDSVEGIMNSALIALGAQPIVSRNDNIKSAILCLNQWDSTRREVLRGFPWRCASRYAGLAASTTAPAFGWQAAFPLPTDCLRVLDCPELASDEEWEVVGNTIYADAGAPLNVIYTSDLQDVTLFDALLAATIAQQLAANIGMALTGSVSKTEAAMKAVQMKLRDARLASSQEASSRELEVDELLAARR